MEKIKIYIILFLIFSCSNSKNIEQFETVLGEENSKTLTFLVNDFENEFLKKYYSNLNTKDAYKQFLVDLRDEKPIDWGKLSKKSKTVFKNSSLRQAMYCIPDSVSIEQKLDDFGKEIDAFIKVKYTCSTSGKYNDFSELFSKMSQYKGMAKDSVIKLYKESEDVNLGGDYSKALEAIPNKSLFLEEFIDNRQQIWGVGSNHVTSLKMLSHDVSFDNYFIKRLIMSEIVLRHN